MFRFDPTIQQLPASRASIAYLAESSNQPNVAVPGKQAQSAQAFAVAVRTSADTVSFYVSLWLAVTREPLFYVYEKERIPLRALGEVADEAWIFCESMGFILDVVPLADHSPVELERILSRLRHDDVPDASDEPSRKPELGAQRFTPGPAQATSPSPAELARLGRLLASF